MKTNQTPLRRLAGAFVRQLQLAAAIGSWAYRAPYPWEFELVNARWPRPARSSSAAAGSAPQAPVCRLPSLSQGNPGCGCPAC